MKPQTKAWSVVAIAMASLLPFCTYKAITTEPIIEKTVTGAGTITEKYINTYACGEYGDPCYDHFFVIDKTTAHYVSSSTYAAFKVSDNVQLAHTNTLNADEIALYKFFGYGWIVLLGLWFAYSIVFKTIFWALFRSNTWGWKEYVID